MDKVRWRYRAAAGALAALAIRVPAGELEPVPLSTWGDLDAVVADNYASFTNCAWLYPPGAFAYAISAGYFTFPPGSEIGAATNLFGADNRLGIPVWTVRVTETQAEERVWLYAGAAETPFRTNAVPAGFDPSQWVEGAYGAAPSWLQGDALGEWYAGRDRSRMRLGLTLVAAGGAAVGCLKYGVTPLFSPDKNQINDMLKRHRVWIHSGHGDHTKGISILEKTGGGYRLSEFRASDITTSGLDYDLVFMNTCESTDTKYIPVPPITPQAMGGWLQDTNFSSHAVMDIGVALNAKNYIGWDCEIARQLSVTIPTMLMQGLDSAGVGQTRTVRDAVQAVRATLQTPPKRDYWWYWERLRYIGDDTTSFDLNKKPF